MTHRRAACEGLPASACLRFVARVRAGLGGIVVATGTRATVRARSRGDRGDVPGWVLVTLMTAGLVLVLWSVARERLTSVFSDAIDGVIGGP